MNETFSNNVLVHQKAFMLRPEHGKMKLSCIHSFPMLFLGILVVLQWKRTRLAQKMRHNISYGSKLNASLVQLHTNERYIF